MPRRAAMITENHGLTALSIARKVKLTKTENPKISTSIELLEIDTSRVSGSIIKRRRGDFWLGMSEDMMR